MEANGWKRCDFDSDESFVEWCSSRPPMLEYGRRVANIIANGLPARLKVVKLEYFLCIEMEPLEGWTWLATESAVHLEMANGWRPHISLSKYTVDEETYKRVFHHYHNMEMNIKIHSVSSGGAAVLAWEGLGADPDLWDLYIWGEFGYKWRDNRFGLHISL